MNAACERAPIYPRPVSDGQFYSPPESVAGQVISCVPFSLCQDARATGGGSGFFFLTLKRWSAGSEEDLDEEGLGRTAVTPQVGGWEGGWEGCRVSGRRSSSV